MGLAFSFGIAHVIMHYSAVGQGLPRFTTGFHLSRALIGWSLGNYVSERFIRMASLTYSLFHARRMGAIEALAFWRIPFKRTMVSTMNRLAIRLRNIFWPGIIKLMTIISVYLLAFWFHYIEALADAGIFCWMKVKI